MELNWLTFVDVYPKDFMMWFWLVCLTCALIMALWYSDSLTPLGRAGEAACTVLLAVTALDATLPLRSPVRTGFILERLFSGDFWDSLSLKGSFGFLGGAEGAQKALLVNL